MGPFTEDLTAGLWDTETVQPLSSLPDALGAGAETLSSALHAKFAESPRWGPSAMSAGAPHTQNVFADEEPRGAYGDSREGRLWADESPRCAGPQLWSNAEEF